MDGRQKGAYMEKPLISIIIPVYNIKDYLERCVRSVCAQTYENLEILLVDDGSFDGTEKLCDKLAEEDARIRVFHKQNGGSSSARNLGISRAKGEFLGFVDSDDYIENSMYELLMAALVGQEASIAQIGRDEVDEKGNCLPDICQPPPEPVFIPSHDFIRELLMHRGDCSFCTKLIARKLFQGRSFPEGELNEDFKLLLHMLAETEGVISLPQQTYHVFYRIGSNTRKADKNEFSRVYGDCVDNADMAAVLVKEKYPDLLLQAMRFGLFQRLEYLLHIPVSQMNKENSRYRRICAYIRKHWPDAVGSPYLTGKNKVYLTLFAVAPKGVRRIHGQMMKCKQRGRV